MKSLFFVSAFLLCSGHAAKVHRAQSVTTPSGMTMDSCKTTCQRFGMKSIGAQFEEVGEAELGSEFKQMSSPVPCSDKCEALFTTETASATAPESVVQTAQTKAMRMRGTKQGCGS